MLERWFRLAERGTTVRTEVLGGATTFVRMAYIIVVNPAVLQAAGIPVGPSTVATILTAVFGSVLMGIYASWTAILRASKAGLDAKSASIFCFNPPLVSSNNDMV